MSTETKNGSNGTANGKHASNGKQVATVVNIVEKKPAPTVPGTQVKTDLPPLEDRLHRLHVLFDLHRKYDKLQEAQQKLTDFEINKDGERSRLVIQDDSRNSFETYNPEIVAEVVAFVKSKIQEKKKAIEPLLKW